MTADCPKVPASGQDVLQRLLELLQMCIQQNELVESAVLNWLEGQNAGLNFPLVDFQRLDFSQQLLADLCTIIESSEFSDMMLEDIGPDTLEKIAGKTTLQYTRQALEQRLEAPPDSATNSAHSSTMNTELDIF